MIQPSPVGSDAQSLAQTRSRLKPMWLAIVAMPLVLPPSVLPVST